MSQKKHCIVLPYREHSIWYKKLLESPDISLIKLETPLSFLRGVNLQECSTAPFQTLLVFIGFKQDTYTINTTSTGSLTTKKSDIRILQDYEIPYQHLRSLSQFSKTSFDNFLDETQRWHDLRQQTVRTMSDLRLSTSQTFHNDFCPTTDTSPLLLMKEHLWSTPQKKLKKIPIFVLNKKRERLGENFTVWKNKPNPCRHCHSKLHETSQCFLHMPSRKEAPLKSTRLRHIIKWTRKFPKQRLPYFKEQIGQGKQLLNHINSVVTPLAINIKNELNQITNLTDIFPREFSQIRNNLHFYIAMGFHKPTLDHLIRGWSPTWIKEPPPLDITHSNIQPEFLQDVLHSDKEHLKTGRISEVPKSFLHYIAPRFAIDQSTPNRKKIRTIWNGRHLTPYLPKRPFKLPTLKTIRGIFTGYIMSIDLKNAYFQFPLSWNARKFFGFRSPIDPNKYFCFNSIPFGLATAPSIFQNFTTNVINIIRSLTGWKIYVYLDDFIFQISTDSNCPKDELEQRAKFVLKIFEILGLRINNKSNIFPTTELRWIGAYINTQYQQNFPTLEKLEKFLILAKQIASRETSTLQDYETLRGIFSHLAPPNASFIAKPIDELIASILTRLPPSPTNADFQKISQTQIPKQEFFTDIMNIWMDDLLQSMNITPYHNFKGKNFVIVTDASTELAGAFCFNKLIKNDDLPQLEPTKDITQFTFSMTFYSRIPANTTPKGQTSSYVRELSALLQGMKIFQHRWKQFSPKTTRLVFFIDNLGLSWSLQKQKFKHSLSNEIYAQIKRVTNKYTTLFLWHPRDTKSAQIADYLSKLPPLSYTNSFFLTYNLTQCPILLTTIDSLLLTKFSIPRQLNNSIITIHPRTTIHQQEIILSYLLKCKFKGILNIPRFPSKPYNEYKKYFTPLGSVPFTQEFFVTDPIILSPKIHIDTYRVEF